MSTLRRGGVALCALACALALLLCAAPEPAWAAGPDWTYDPNNQTLTNNDDEKVVLQHVTGDATGGLTVGGPGFYDQALNATFAGELDLSGEVKGDDDTTVYTITSIGDYAFRNCTSLEFVEIPDGVTSIGNSAFYGCSKLGFVEIPDGVATIGYQAFYGCSKLGFVEIPDGVTSIGGHAFQGCTSLEAVVIPDTVTTIGTFAFYGCSKLGSAEIPDGVKSIEIYAFYGCTSLEAVVIPAGVTSIGTSAFRNCSKLASVEIPDGVTTIGGYAFCGCTSLESVTIPAGVTTIGGYAFSDCSSLGSVRIPSEVTSIGDAAFSGCSSLGRVVVMANTPPNLGTGVFNGCHRDMEVVVPATRLDDYKASWTGLDLRAGYSLTVNSDALPGLYAGGDEVAPPEGVEIGEGQHAKWVLLDGNDWEDTTYGQTLVLRDLDGPSAPVGPTIFATYEAEEHSFSEWEADEGGTTHTRTCACSETETERHTFSGRYCSVCGAEDPNYVPPVPTYRAEVSASEGGTASVSPAWARAGQEVTVTCSPDEGFEVRSVSVLDRDGGPVEVSDSGDGTWSFAMPSGGATVEVAFGCDGGELCPGRAFADVDTSQWYHDAVDAAVTSGLMTGYADGSGLFGPGDELTRAQAATVLWRALGGGAQAPACGMADVDPGAWYAQAVGWAVQSGLMTGYADGSGLFGVADPLTREQLATVLWRAAGSPDAGAFDPSAFSDGGEASAWAGPALAWAVSAGVLGGSDDGAGDTELRPTEAVTRAEVAAMLSRWLATE